MKSLIAVLGPTATGKSALGITRVENIGVDIRKAVGAFVNCANTA